VHGTYCLFENADGNGRMYVLGNPVAGQRHNIATWFNDRTTSLWNRSGKRVSLYQNADCGTLLTSSAAYGGPQNLPWNFNDRGTSACVLA
jgi:hypothetical protein